MIRVAAILAAALLLATSASAQSNTHSDIVPAPTWGCAMQLAQTLAAIEVRPLMTEELATALMWLRLDAADAAADGDEATCLELMAVVEALLGPSALTQPCKSCVLASE